MGIQTGSGGGDPFDRSQACPINILGIMKLAVADENSYVMWVSH